MKEELTFGQWLRGERERRGWSQAKMAQHMGVHLNTIQRWEAEQVEPSDRRIQDLAQILGLPYMSVKRRLVESTHPGLPMNNEEQEERIGHLRIMQALYRLKDKSKEPTIAHCVESLVDAFNAEWEQIHVTKEGERK